MSPINDNTEKGLSFEKAYADFGRHCVETNHSPIESVQVALQEKQVVLEEYLYGYWNKPIEVRGCPYAVVVTRACARDNPHVYPLATLENMLKLERLVWVYSLSQGERARPPVKGYEKSETAQFIFTRKDKNEFCITKQETGGILVESVLTAKQDNPYLTDTLMAAIQRRVNNVLADKDKNTFKALEGLMGLERVAVKNTVSSTKSLVSLLESTLRKGEVETTLFHIKDKAEFKDAAKLLKVDPLTVLEEDIVFLKEYTLFMQRVADDMSRKTVMPQEFLLEERMGSALLYYIEKNREILCELADKGLLIDIPKYVSTIGVPYRGNVIEMRHLDILSLFRFVAQCIVVRRQKEIMELPKRMSIPSEKGIHLCDPT